MGRRIQSKNLVATKMTIHAHLKLINWNNGVIGNCLISIETSCIVTGTMHSIDHGVLAQCVFELELEYKPLYPDCESRSAGTCDIVPDCLGYCTCLGTGAVQDTPYCWCLSKPPPLIRVNSQLAAPGFEPMALQLDYELSAITA